MTLHSSAQLHMHPYSAHCNHGLAPMFGPRCSLSDFHMNKLSDPNMKFGLNLAVYKSTSERISEKDNPKPLLLQIPENFYQQSSYSNKACQGTCQEQVFCPVQTLTGQNQFSIAMCTSLRLMSEQFFPRILLDVSENSNEALRRRTHQQKLS